MSKNKREKYERRRVRSSYISVTASTTLVLFILALIGLLVLSSDRLSRHIKENFAVGLISHVDELKTRIENKILVSAATETHGSTIKTETYA